MSVAKADKLFNDAEKKSSKFDWFGMNKSANQEDAADLYVKAAAQFKRLKEYKKSGDSYKLAAECQMSAGNEIEAKQSWRDAGMMYRHIDPQLCMEAFRNAIQFSLDADKFSQAARLEEEIGDMLAEDDHHKEAIESWEKAAEYYEAENDQGNADKRLLKVAHLAPKLNNYERSIEVFEAVSKRSVDDKLRRWKVKEYLFKALLCHCCAGAADEIRSWNKLQDTSEKYKDISAMFGDSRECKLMDKVIDSLMKTNIDTFKDALVEFESIQRLEPWTVDLMLKLENYIKEGQHPAPFDSDNDDNDEKKDDTINTDAPVVTNQDPFNQASEAPADAPDLDDL